MGTRFFFHFQETSRIHLATRRRNAFCYYFFLQIIAKGPAGRLNWFLGSRFMVIRQTMGKSTAAAVPVAPENRENKVSGATNRD